VAKNLEQIFEECLERVLQGETIESCLMRYPNEAAGLEPLLRTALGVTNRAAALKPDPEFKARAGMQLQGALYAAAQPKPQEKQKGFNWQRSWAFALSAVVLLLFSGVGTAFASTNALPDQPLYGAKLAKEQVQLAFTFSEEKKAALHADFAEQRAQEMEAMVEVGKTDYVILTAAKLDSQMEQAESAIKKLEIKEAAEPVSIALSQRPPAPAAEPAISEAAPTAPEAAPAITPAPAKLGDDSESGASANETLPGPPAEIEQIGSEKVERAWNKFNQSASKNLVVLERVLDKSPDKAKPALKEVIDRIRERAQQRNLDTRPESQSDKPEKNEKDDFDKKPQTKSDQSKPKDNGNRPVEQGELIKPADTPNQTPNKIQPSDNNSNYSRPSVTTTPSQPGHTWKEPDDTDADDDSEDTESTSIVPSPNYNTSSSSEENQTIQIQLDRD
jgi:hypothetical protein